VRSFEELIGRTELLESLPGATDKHRGLDLAPILSEPAWRRISPSFASNRATPFDKGRTGRTDGARLPTGHRPPSPVASSAIRSSNIHRSIGARLSGEIARRHGNLGMESAPIKLRLTGTAGQSFGVWNAGGLHHLSGRRRQRLRRQGHGRRQAGDPSARGSRFDGHRTPIIGNTCLYGATGGSCTPPGPRRALRGAQLRGAAVVEGVGDHGCEYMTGGVVVVLGPPASTSAPA
jgi:glutamate synthase (NADPH/NADH) large chain